MRILAIETSAAAGSLAVVDETGALLEVQLPATERNAKTLAPALERLLDETGREQLDGVAVSIGPGSFTGLRVGIATAKTLGWALNLPIAGVPTLEAIAYQASVPIAEGRVPQDNSQGHENGTNEGGEAIHLSVASNAYRSQVFACHATLPVNTDSPSQIEKRPQLALAEPFSIVSHTDWLGALPQFAWVSGPALRIPRPQAYSEALAQIQVVPESLWDPQAVTIGQLGRQRLLAGEAVAPTALLPDYGRLSAAEEKRQAQQR